jgi:hypothetical protein
LSKPFSLIIAANKVDPPKIYRIYFR